MGCNHSQLIKRRHTRPTTTTTNKKIISNDDSNVQTLKISTKIDHRENDETNYCSTSTSASDYSSTIIKEKLDDTEAEETTTQANHSRSPLFHRFDLSTSKNQRLPSSKKSTAPSKLFFKHQKRSNEKLNLNQPAGGGGGIINRSTSSNDRIKDKFERKLSTPAIILSTPSIVVDEAPPPSAPPNGTLCSNKTMWDILTSGYDDSSQPPQPQPQPSNSNGLIITKNRLMNFGRQKSNEKIVTQSSSKDKDVVDGTVPLNEDRVLNIIKCFPFPSPKHSPRNSPPLSPKSTATILQNGPPKLFLDCQQQQSACLTTQSLTVKDSATINVSSEKETKKPSTTINYLKQKLSDPTNGGRNRDKSNYSALGEMVRKTIETTFPPLIPWDVWLRKRLASWTQCSGHQGTIVPATEKTVWKKCCHDSNEAKAYKQLMEDEAASILAPKFYKEVEHKGEFFMELEDLSRNFVDPCIMDVKMGTRTFLESEVRNASKRADLYEKMIAIDPSEPSASEREEKAITKLRYMTFREQMSSSSELGFRIDAAKMSGGPLQRDFQKVRTREQIMDVLRHFLGPNNSTICKTLLRRLRLMREKIEISEFFRCHEVIGSSILIIHDSRNIGAWIIDFAKALPIENGKIDHRSLWQLDNGEDGYLFGLDNLIEIIEEIDLNNKSEKCRTVSFADDQLKSYTNSAFHNAPISIP